MQRFPLQFLSLLMSVPFLAAVLSGLYYLSAFSLRRLSTEQLTPTCFLLLQYNEKGAVTDDYLFKNPCPAGSMCNRNPGP